MVSVDSYEGVGIPSAPSQPTDKWRWWEIVLAIFLLLLAFPAGWFGAIWFLEWWYSSGPVEWYALLT